MMLSITMKQYLCTHMFLLFVLLPALVLCMVTPPAESSTLKRPLELNLDVIDESPVPAKRVAFSEGIEGLTQQTMEIEESAESKKRKRTSSPIALEILASAAAERVPISHVVTDATFQIETLAEQVFSDPIGPISHVASFLNYDDSVNLMSSKRKLRNLRLFYSNMAFRIPFDATEDDVRLILPSIKKVSKVTIDFNLGHLTILNGCPDLRHLIVKKVSPDVGMKLLHRRS
jgi:hypothetical protein